MEKYYVSGCRDDGEATVTCDDSEATFWTLYARDDKGLSQGIIDLAFREDAEAAMAVYAERDALQEQVQTLAAENAALKDAFHPETVPDDLLDNFGDAVKMDGDTFWEGDNCTSFSWVSNAEELIKLSLVSMGDIETPATDAVIREIGVKAVESCDDAKRMNWLCSHVVQVRKPLLYGSHEMFYAQCDSDDCEEYHSTLREQVDAAIRAGEQP